MNRHRVLAFLVINCLVLAWAGCSDDDTVGADAQVTKDGGTVDSNNVADLGNQPEAGKTPDAGGIVDSSQNLDSMIKTDLAPIVDAGKMPDSVSVADSAISADLSINPDANASTDAALGNDGFLPPQVVSGKVLNAETEKPVSNITVSVVGASPPNTAITNSLGEYSLNIAQGSIAFLKVQQSGFYSGMRGLVVPPGGKTNIELYLMPTTLISGVISVLGFPKMDLSKGGASLAFTNASTGGGEGASLSASNDGSFTLSSSGTPIKSSKLLANGLTSLMFLNVAAGNTSITLTAPKCKLAYPSITSYPIHAGTFTDVSISCTP